LSKDTSEALRLYRLAAEKGNKAAQEKVKELEGRLQADTAVIQN
jgi:TPR repeat protein